MNGEREQLEKALQLAIMNHTGLTLARVEFATDGDPSNDKLIPALDHAIWWTAYKIRKFQAKLSVE